MAHRVRFAVMLALGALLAVGLASCANEAGNPLGTERLGSDPPKHEEFGMELDARGFVNGVFQPPSPLAPQVYPVHYEGSWQAIPADSGSRYFLMTSAASGSTLTVAATASRIIVEFWDYDFYQGEGAVSFTLDGASLGTFELARRNANGDKILQYLVTTDGSRLASVTMTILTGRVVISGIYLVFARQSVPPRAMAARLPHEFRQAAFRHLPDADPDLCLRIAMTARDDRVAAAVRPGPSAFAGWDGQRGPSGAHATGTVRAGVGWRPAPGGSLRRRSGRSGFRPRRGL